MDTVRAQFLNQLYLPCPRCSMKLISSSSRWCGFFFRQRIPGTNGTRSQRCRNRKQSDISARFNRATHPRRQGNSSSSSYSFRSNIRDDWSEKGIIQFVAINIIPFHYISSNSTQTLTPRVSHSPHLTYALHINILSSSHLHIYPPQVSLTPISRRQAVTSSIVAFLSGICC
jgi:hypothetical protein